MPRSGTEEEGGRKYNFRELYDNRIVWTRNLRTTEDLALLS